MARVLARLESPVDDLPFPRTEDLDRLSGSKATLVSSKWIAAMLEQHKNAGQEIIQDEEQLLIELDDGLLVIESFQYYIDNRQGGQQS